MCPQAISPAALHPSEASPKSAKMLKHLQREAHQTRSAVEVKRGSSPQALSPAALYPSEVSP